MVDFHVAVQEENSEVAVEIHEEEEVAAGLVSLKYFLIIINLIILIDPSQFQVVVDVVLVDFLAAVAQNDGKLQSLSILEFGIICLRKKSIHNKNLKQKTT